jgi:DNA phosphorothioation-dependent restriction protein DptG
MQQEKIDQRPLLQKLEMLLGESDERLHELDHAIDDELWEHAWYAFTDEWAWFRAKRDVEKELGDAFAQTSDTSVEKLCEAKYRKHFEEYVAEVDMLDDVKQSRPSHKQPKV